MTNPYSSPASNPEGKTPQRRSRRRWLWVAAAYSLLIVGTAALTVLQPWHVLSNDFENPIERHFINTLAILLFASAYALAVRGSWQGRFEVDFVLELLAHLAVGLVIVEMVSEWVFETIYQL